MMSKPVRVSVAVAVLMTLAGLSPMRAAEEVKTLRPGGAAQKLIR